MLKPNKAILKQIKAYDKRLDVKWNNADCHWEIWYKTAWGNRLITPVVESIYREGAKATFHPLDSKILEWLHSSDSNRVSRKWRWLNKKLYLERKAREQHKFYVLAENMAKDNYNLINQELINPYIEHSDWLAPDINGKSKGRMMYRSGENAKEYFNDIN